MTDSSHDVPNDSAKSPCVRRPCARWLPLLPLAVAAVLYGYSLHAGKYARTAKAVRTQAGRPFSQVLAVYRLEGRATGIIRVLPPDLATKLMEAMASANPMPPFKEDEMLEGDQCDIIVTYPSGARATFSAVRLYNDPDTLYVGTILPENVTGAETNATPTFTLSPPARVRKAGRIIGQLIGEINAMSENLPSDEELQKTVSRESH